MSGTTLYLFLFVSALMSIVLFIVGLLPQPGKGMVKQKSLAVWGVVLMGVTVSLFILKPMLFPGS
ncbi:hypothetical protein [Aneurinibacillus terranovensis]|uniref:hypothetical protein n=1 Tax=Aneurinibacillus terranovensis TaxID=278991 RepID=UPI0003FE3B27|nr:hypothetical protein [Aneurinibacillus terranovensis]